MPGEQDLEGVVREAFSRTREYVWQEVDIVPLTLWNESILRYCFCRSVANDDTEVKQFIECDRIDLVLSRGTSRAFIEFKFYRHPRRFDPYSGQMRGFKGGPGRKNLGEFQSCIDKLHERRYVPGLSKYVILLYAEDPPDIGSRRKVTYSRDYDAYEHPRQNVTVREVAVWEPFVASEELVKGRLYKVGLPDSSGPFTYLTEAKRAMSRALGTGRFAKVEITERNAPSDQTRQVESIAPTSTKDTKESKQAVLHEAAERLGVKEFLDEVASFIEASFIEARLHSYRWPHKTSYSFFSRRCHYANLKLNLEQPGSLLLTLAPRAVAACDDAVNEFCKDVPVAVRNQESNSALDVSMSRDEWTTMSKPLVQLLSAIVDGWKRSAADD